MKPKDKQIGLKGTAGELREFFKFVLQNEINEMSIEEALTKAKERYKKLKGEQKHENKN